ncbi:hypothetical protein Amet_3120 [Alkaliphilus metalliredigens QYMF]|uniref:Uncharacterized protein n=1 Tax=Alkaliphilus metalliredigens (strain QYMF) TaxID=293826 RepID=A6TSU1_ALKMQ|nr:hypothetical protein [Alkaliphilus metalliredigens]ABR49259.1 hypothetical protein Amet_3120 [Alkaliphilus metalliredigens QYMF]
MSNTIGIINRDYDSAAKNEFKELIKVILDLSDKADRQGLLSLDEEYPSLNSYFFRKSIELIVEGFHPEVVRNILQNYIDAKECSEGELLEKRITMEGALLIQSGARRKILFEKILSIFGEEFFQDFEYSFFEEEQSLKYNEEDTNAISEESITFEDRILSIVLNDDMNKLVKRAGYFNMALALKVSSGKLNVHVRNILNANDMVEELNGEVIRIGPMLLKDGLAAQEFVLRLI